MFHAAPAQRPPSGPQPTKKFSSNSRFSAAAPSGVRQHMVPAAFLVQQPPLRRRSAGNHRLSGAKNGGPATGNDRKELPPVQLPKNTGFTSGSADDKPPHDAPGSTSAQRPDARRYESTARATFASAPVFPPEPAREQPGARDRSCKKQNRLAPFLCF